MTEDDDPYRWLEDLDDEVALAWVRERNAESAAELGGERFEALRAELRAVLDAADRLPVPVWRGEHLYNFWRDAEHPRGIWRRTTLAEYRTPEPAWETVLDIDALAAAEGENWVWQGAEFLKPDCHRCLVQLSRGGADASVVREFDVRTNEFVPEGFVLPEAKTSLAWIDQDRIFVGTDFGPGTLTSSGYPRQVREWRRDTPLEEAPVVFEGAADDVSVHAWRDHTPGYERDFIGRHLDFYRGEKYVRQPDGELVRIEVPDDATIDAHLDWLLIRLRTPWTVDERTYPAGALLAARLDDFLAGGRDLVTLFEPDDRTSLDYHAKTSGHVILTELSDVRSRLEIVVPGESKRTLLTDAAGSLHFGHTDVVATNHHHNDDYLLLSSGFTEPATLRYGRAGATEPETLRSEPAFFDAAGMVVEQHFAVSDDGTRVPYFVVGDPTRRPGPTLMRGYGGFRHSLTPYYSGIVGRAWLARGGTFVVANIRGGGEYGPRWHHAALRDKRLRAYEDFAAVASDLVARGITTVAQLGAEGGSNGGLLTGVMLTRYPDRFGAIVSQVPLLDMRHYHEWMAGASWMAEYGDPDDPADWSFLRGYSPYHNVHKGQTYPPVLFMTSTRDDRVHPAHARKMVARMRGYDLAVSYYENIEGGHGGAADNAQLAAKWARAYEFLWRHLGP